MITVLVIVVIVLGLSALLYSGRGRARGSGGRRLKRQFGPEYDRVVADHDGDVRAAEQELDERVRRHGSLRERPLSPSARAQYVAEWTALQERFVASPHEAVTEADELLARLARDRGFPGAERFEEQWAALSVHHAYFVEGYRDVHTAARGRSGTEEMREAMVEARGLFEALAGEPPVATGGRRLASPGGRGSAAPSPQ
ncbi:hypothetical protein ABZT23_13635 [Streptomyces sp. NPDC005386]|uniref:hypothetical protein n=1 Tax=Streptomyces sp. NPDC005386 TaxID=3154562 RepID=UPI0033BE37E2